MTGFSAGGAIGAGFRLIARRPVAFLAWTLTLMLIGVLPQLWAFSQLFASVGDLARLAPESPGAGPSAEMFQMQARMMRIQPVFFLSGTVSTTLVTAAVYRAALGLEEKSFFYLRLGSRELWLGLVTLLLTVALPFAGMALILPIGVIAGVAALAHVQALYWLIPVAMVVAIGVGTWAVLRISMAPVMSFSENTFILPESWALTRGHALKMFWVALALGVIVWVVQMVLFGAAIAAANAVIPLQELFGAPGAKAFPDLTRLGYGFWFGVAIGAALFSTFVSALFGAAWAEMYRGLRPAQPPAA